MINHGHSWSIIFPKNKFPKKWWDPIQFGTNPNLLIPPLYRSRVGKGNAKDVSQPLRRFSGKGNKYKLHMSVTYSMHLDLKPIWVAFKTFCHSNLLIGFNGDSHNGIWWSSMYWVARPSIIINQQGFSMIFNTVDLFRMDPRRKTESQSLGLEHTGHMGPKWTAVYYKWTKAWVCPNIKHGVAWNPNCWYNWFL